jgi:hypothetical protein
VPNDHQIYGLLGDQVHRNQLTNCIIWAGDFDRNQQPIANFLGIKTRVRDLVIKAMGGKLERGMTILPACENIACVNHEHFQVEIAEQPAKPEVSYTEEELKTVAQLTQQGFRQEVIAERLGTTRPRVAKMVRVLKDRVEAPTNES